MEKKISELLLNTEIITQLMKLIEECTTEPLSLKNQMAMIGTAATLAGVLDNMKGTIPEKELTELDNKIQALWEKWHSKNIEFAKQNKDLVKKPLQN